MSKANETENTRLEMRIAQFWRALIGDYEYNKYSPDDLLRWYYALDVLGPIEVRALVDERFSASANRVPTTGIVALAPHPPIWIVREWLDHYEQRTHTASYWTGVAALLLLLVILGSLSSEWPFIQSSNPLILNPPNTQIVPSSTGLTPVFGNAPPVQPPLVTSLTPTAPQSAGIAGASGGLTPASGSTGPVSGGIAGSVVSTGPGQPP